MSQSDSCSSLSFDGSPNGSGPCVGSVIPLMSIAMQLSKLDEIMAKVEKLERTMACWNKRLPTLCTIEQLARIGKDVDTNTQTIFGIRDLFADYRTTMTENVKYIEGRVIGQTQKIDSLLKHNGLPVFSEGRLPGSDYRCPIDLNAEQNGKDWMGESSGESSGESFESSCEDEVFEICSPRYRVPPPAASLKPPRKLLKTNQTIDLRKSTKGGNVLDCGSDCSWSPDGFDPETLRTAFYPKRKQ